MSFNKTMDRYPNWWREKKRRAREAEEARMEGTFVGRLFILWRTWIV